MVRYKNAIEQEKLFIQDLSKPKCLCKCLKHVHDISQSVDMIMNMISQYIDITSIELNISEKFDINRRNVKKNVSDIILS